MRIQLAYMMILFIYSFVLVNGRKKCFNKFCSSWAYSHLFVGIGARQFWKHILWLDGLELHLERFFSFFMMMRGLECRNLCLKVLGFGYVGWKMGRKVASGRRVAGAVRSLVNARDFYS